MTKHKTLKKNESKRKLTFRSFSDKNLYEITSIFFFIFGLVTIIIIFKRYTGWVWFVLRKPVQIVWHCQRKFASDRVKQARKILPKTIAIGERD